MPNWFDIDKQGLAKLMDGRPKSFIIGEMYQNCVDTNAKQVEIRLEKLAGTPKAKLTVIDDDPEGFKNFSHAWTMFAESTKKGDPTKRGIYNMGEKLVLALCYTASIKTTKGTVEFNDDGRQEFPRRKTEKGSTFEGVFRLNQEEYDECCAFALKLIPPAGVNVYFNGSKLEHRTPLSAFEATLDTTKSNEETGVVSKTRRKTEVRVFEPKPGEVPSVYEMGIPVVETDDKWHVDIQQRVPLNMNRDNVLPAFLKEVRTLVVNHMHDKLDEADANATFVNEALSDPDASKEAVDKAMDLKYGKDRALFDQKDPEANANILARGGRIIYPSQLTKAQHENVRRYESARPAGVILPTQHALFAPGGKDCWVPKEKWTPAMRKVVDYSRELGQKLLDRSVNVDILSDVTEGYGACYGSQGLVFNLGRLSKAFFEDCATGATDALNQLLIHEFSHEIESNHLSDKYHEASCKLGAKLARLALDNPRFFKW